MGSTKKYTAEFRAEAVRLVLSSGRSQREVAESLGISKYTLSNWVVADGKGRARAADPDALSEDERNELKRLRKEVTDLKTDREILRKAAAFFARETMR